MTTVAVTMVKDEADIIEPVIRHMATQVDHIIVADNMSTDDTRLTLESLADELGDIMIQDDREVGYQQSKKMTGLAHLAEAEFGAEWIVPFDADEIWYSPFYDRIADHLADIEVQWLVMPATVFDHMATGDDPDVPNPVLRMGWRRREPLELPKVACRWRRDLTIEMGNHGARYHGGATMHEAQLVVRHFPYRSVDQLIRKIRNGAAAYAATNMPANVGTHWREWGAMLDQQGPEAIEELFTTWYYVDSPHEVSTTPMIYDPAPAVTP